ncbi:unnamed protein product [Mytilus edulis]|uniref:Uncharacterized protein n=1 Tax=Mytilus edulis TaxID=6550 RepID=A0A8S3PMC2_MYTED|nr:unnamed protein product [Mytilus edulis]
MNSLAKSNISGERLHDLDITIGPSHNQMSLCAHYKGLGRNGEHLAFTCHHTNKYTRYVKLTIKGKDYLQVGEIKLSNGDYLRRLEKIESQLADNTGKLQEILSRLPKGICEKDDSRRTSKCKEGRPIDCNDIPDKCPSGVYKVYPKNTQGIDVYCEMVLDEGHWTVGHSNHNKHCKNIRYHQVKRINRLENRILQG